GKLRTRRRGAGRLSPPPSRTLRPTSRGRARGEKGRRRERTRGRTDRRAREPPARELAGRRRTRAPPRGGRGRRPCRDGKRSPRERAREARPLEPRPRPIQPPCPPSPPPRALPPGPWRVRARDPHRGRSRRVGPSGSRKTKSFLPPPLTDANRDRVESESSAESAME